MYILIIVMMLLSLGSSKLSQSIGLVSDAAALETSCL